MRRPFYHFAAMIGRVGVFVPALVSTGAPAGAQEPPVLVRPKLDLKLPLPTGPPNKKGLIIILENGGIDMSLIPGLKSVPLPPIRYAVYKGKRFEMRQGESLVSLINRVKNRFFGDLGVVNPNNWEIRSITFEEWFKPFSDRIVEDMAQAVSFVQSNSGSQRYDKVWVLRRNAVPVEALATIRQNAAAYVLDIHVLTHGTSGAFIGVGGQRFNDQTFFKPLRDDIAAGRLKLHLRAVYQMNCSSGTLVESWRQLGARVVNGTNGADLNFMPSQYQHFARHWMNNVSFGTAITRAFDEAKPFYSVVWALKPGRVSQSKMRTTGEAGLKMSTRWPTTIVTTRTPGLS